MQYFNVHLDTLLTSAEWLESTREQHSIWLSLMREACRLEMSGRIPGCRQWSEKIWLHKCGVNPSDVLQPSLLWRWEEDTLVLLHYQQDQEDKVKKKKKWSKTANKKRWGKKKEWTNQIPDSDTESGVDSDTESEKESKVKESKCTPSIPRDDLDGSIRCSGVQVSDDEVIAFGESFQGEPATGCPPMPKEWVFAFVSKMNGRTVGWPADWKRAMVASWRMEFRKWLRDGEVKKNARAGVPSEAGEESPAMRRFRLEKAVNLKRIELNAVQAIGFDWRKVHAELQELEGQLGCEGG